MLGSIEAAVYDTDSAGYENPRYGFVLLVMAKDSPSNRDSTCTGFNTTVFGNQCNCPTTQLVKIRQDTAELDTYGRYINSYRV
jgi:hypothetical protein